MSTTEAIEVVNLARAFNIPSILPAAFYVCSRLSPKVLMEGIVYPDGRRSVLSPADLLRCWNGQQELDRRYAVALQDLRNVIAGDFCEDEDECSEAKKNHDEKEMCSTMGCCLASTSWLDEDLADEVTLCDCCTEARVSSWKEFRSDTWNALPEIFDLKDANEAS
ncbi:hypothetical protein QCA50_005625 [Cerrena zonata]|uniref:Uncharacterized protein n=1 Tax=Cerrena zonata TaxID=2478898 RepID=A0AAW0GFQ4_9APHY